MRVIITPGTTGALGDHKGAWGHIGAQGTITGPRDQTRAWGPQWGLWTQMWPGDHNGYWGQPEGQKHNGTWDRKGPGDHKGAWLPHWSPGTLMGPRDHNRAQGPQWGLGTTTGPRDHNEVPVTRRPKYHTLD